jgi:hypothetical protein
VESSGLLIHPSRIGLDPLAGLVEALPMTARIQRLRLSTSEIRRAPRHRFRTLWIGIICTLIAILVPTRSATARQQLVPEVGGQWSPIYDWSGQITCPSTCTDKSDLSAGALLPIGLHRGKIVFWRESCDQCVTANRTTESWLFDPADPDDLIKIVHPPLPTDLFCGGFSWNKEGWLLVTGGVPTGTAGFAVWTYYFEPALLEQVVYDIHTGLRNVPGQSAWEHQAQGDLWSGRYYPSVCPLSRRPLAGSPAFAGGGHLVLGGSPNPYGPPAPVMPGCTAPSTHPGGNIGTDVWQHMAPSADHWDDRVLYPAGSTPPTPTSIPYDRRDIAGNLVNGNPNANPIAMLETYPRAFQLADLGGVSTLQQQIFVAFDVPTFSNTWSLNNPYGAAWVVKPAYGTQAWELQEAATGFERFYGNALLFHTPTNKNRIVVIGGAQNTSTATPPWNAPNWAMVSDVQEFIIPGGQGAAAGYWQLKSNGPSRTMANAVILPTGQVLILGGSTTVDSCDADPTIPIAYAPVIYDIGSSPTSPGSVVATMNESNKLGGLPVPRLYHSMAALLEDGRVLHAAGETYPVSAGFGPSGKTGEVFSPPYLFQGTRPTITSAPSDAGFWSTSTPTMQVMINHSFPIDRIVLLRLATVTHAFDIDQRYIELPFTIQSGSSGTHRATVTLPAEDLGPPGWYMMYAVQNDSAHGYRVPSIAWWIRFT